MERQKVSHRAQPAYPTCAALTPGLVRRIALAAALATAPLIGCDTVNEVDGLMADPSEPWGVTLPAEGSHMVVLSAAAAELDYHLDLVVQGTVVDCVTGQADALLAAADEVLAVREPAIFEAGGDLGPVEAAVTEALAQSCEAAVGDIVETDLVVDDLRLFEDTGL